MGARGKCEPQKPRQPTDLGQIFKGLRLMANPVCFEPLFFIGKVARLRRGGIVRRRTMGTTETVSLSRQATAEHVHIAGRPQALRGWAYT